MRALALALALTLAAPAHAAPPGDLEGLWTTSTLTPYARPAAFKALAVPEAEAVAYERQRRSKPPEAATDDVGGAETDWWETDVGLARVRGQARSSWIVSPADGRVPFTLQAQAANRARQARAKSDFAGPEVRPDGERCLNAAAPPLSSAGANDGFRVVQTPGAVVIHIERTNTARIVRMGAKHGPSAIRTRDGESVGWWEGPTLVVDTRNFADPATAAPGEDRTNMRVIERITRSGPRELHYGFFLSNPGRYTQPIQGEMVFRAATSPIFEVACHEGNYALANILAGARVEETAAAKGAPADREAGLGRD